MTSYKFKPSWSGAQTSPSLVPRPHPAFCLGSGGMSYCNQTPFSLREGGVWARQYSLNLDTIVAMQRFTAVWEVLTISLVLTTF